MDEVCLRKHIAFLCAMLTFAKRTHHLPQANITGAKRGITYHCAAGAVPLIRRLRRHLLPQRGRRLGLVLLLLGVVIRIGRGYLGCGHLRRLSPSVTS